MRPEVMCAGFIDVGAFYKNWIEDMFRAGFDWTFPSFVLHSVWSLLDMVWRGIDAKYFQQDCVIIARFHVTCGESKTTIIVKLVVFLYNDYIQSLKIS